MGSQNYIRINGRLNTPMTSGLIGHNGPDVSRVTCPICGKRWRSRSWTPNEVPAHGGVDQEYCPGSYAEGLDLEVTWV